MIAIIKKPNTPAETSEVGNDYETSKRLVGGYIECVTLDNGVCMVCNEEGKIYKLPPNLYLRKNKVGMDVVVGSVFFCSDTPDGEFASLTTAQQEYVHKFIKENSV